MRNGAATATQSVINYSGWATAGLARDAAPGTSSSRGVEEPTGTREPGWRLREHWDAWKEEKGKGLGTGSSPSGVAREGDGVAASPSPFFGGDGVPGSASPKLPRSERQTAQPRIA